MSVPEEQSPTADTTAEPDPSTVDSQAKDDATPPLSPSTPTAETHTGSPAQTHTGSPAQTPSESPSEPTTEPAEPPVKEKELEGASRSTTPPLLASPVFCEGWSRLSREEIVDRVKGAIYGQAIGDALGLATEFMSRVQAQKTYGKAGPKAYSDIVPDFHRARWDKGDWTDDTDQMLLILQSIVENGRVDRVDFAARLHNWMKCGFKELGDIGGMGIGFTVHRTLNHALFLTDPHAAAQKVWEESGRYLAANGAIMRTSILGVLNFNDLGRVVENTREICRTTHADPRCSASCIAVTTAIAQMLQGQHDPCKKKDLEKIIGTSLKLANEELILDDQKKEMQEHVMASSLEKLKLDDHNTIGYTFKALGTGFYGLRTSSNFRKTIMEVIMQAGDADSNGSVCGAMIGCKLGFKALPQDLLGFPHRDWLDQQVQAFFKTIGLE